MTTPELRGERESKAYPGQTPKPRTRKPSAWISPFKRDLSYWGFVLNRVAGAGLVVYLILHLVVLSTLLNGEAGWDNFLRIAKSPAFLTLDVILIAGILGHGLNGLRVALVGSGLMVKRQRQLFIGFMVIAVMLLVVSAILVYTA